MHRISLFPIVFVLFAGLAHAQDPADDAPVPVPVPAPEDVADAPTRVLAIPPTNDTPFDAAAEVIYRECQRLLDAARDDGDRAAAQACFADLSRRAPHTEAGLKAGAALYVMDVELVPSSSSGLGFNIAAGRLGATTAIGAFGAWNAIAGGIVVGAVTNGSIPGQVLVVGTGLAAVGLGVGFGVGGYLLSEKLELDEGAARLLASSLVWGTVVGASLGVTVGSQIGLSSQNYTAAGTAGVLTVVATGYAFGGLSLLLTSNLSFDEAQVGFINSGGFVGSVVGLLVMANLPYTTGSPIPYSAAFVGATSLGLVGGGVLGRSLDATWGEVLICDLAGVLGLVAGGAVGVGLGINSSGPGFASVMTGAGLVGGYAAGIGVVSAWRTSRGAPILRGENVEVRPSTSMVFDGKTTVPTFGISGRL